MVFYNNQIIFPEEYRVPNYSVSPFSTEQLKVLNNIISDDELSNQRLVLNEKFGSHEFLMSAKEAISKALSFYNLQKDDEVYIVTTTSNKYVSSCVTNQIEKYCNWSRTLSDTTKLIFVIHEFGAICEDLPRLSKLNIPIIEDFAMSMFSEKGVDVVNLSDFKIYSLPKFFPVQFGGVLTYNNSKFISRNNLRNDEDFQLYLKKVSCHFLIKKHEIVLKRKNNQKFYQKAFKNFDIKTRFNLAESETPSVYMFSSNSINLDELKIFLQKNGVECSKFYGENSFFLPIHQNLDEFDINCIANLVKYFVYENR